MANSKDIKYVETNLNTLDLSKYNGQKMLSYVKYGVLIIVIMYDPQPSSGYNIDIISVTANKDSKKVIIKTKLTKPQRGQGVFDSFFVPRKKILINSKYANYHLEWVKIP